MAGHGQRPTVNQLAAGIKDDRLRHLLDYWERKRGSRRFPARADIDPLDFPYAMGWITLLEVERNPVRFRFRLHGTQLLAKNKYDLTGKYLEDHPLPEFAAHCRRVWTEVVEREEPTHGFYDQVVDGRARKFEVLRLPLAADGETIDMLLVCTVYSD
jgi:hypothetical protein